jgi:hypothetical protein
METLESSGQHSALPFASKLQAPRLKIHIEMISFRRRKHRTKPGHGLTTTWQNQPISPQQQDTGSRTNKDPGQKGPHTTTHTIQLQTFSAELSPLNKKYPPRIGKTSSATFKRLGYPIRRQV